MLKPVTELLLVHDDREGSATMGLKMLEEILEKHQLTLPVRKIHYKEVGNQSDTLAIVLPHLEEAMKEQEIQHLVIETFAQTKTYEVLAEQLKAIS